MLYLLRFTETGREAQVSRRKTARDIITALEAEIPDIRIVARETGRLVVEIPGDGLAAVSRVHGVASFSPCHHVVLDELEDSIVELSADAVRDAETFRVRIKRVGDHDFSSAKMAAALGARISQRFPHLVVDLTAPGVVVGVEIRDRDCYVFDRIIPGADRRRSATTPADGSGESIRFIVDQMLGPLAGWLRLLGFDSEYILDVPDCHLVRHASKERRIILTRDRELSETPAVTALYLNSTSLPEQLDEVAEALGLRFDPARMFTRCSLCNGPVERVDKKDFVDRLPSAAYEEYDEFTMCRACDKLYWKGGQHDRILSELRHIVAPGDEPAAD